MFTTNQQILPSGPCSTSDVHLNRSEASSVSRNPTDPAAVDKIDVVQEKPIEAGGAAVLKDSQDPLKLKVGQNADFRSDDNPFLFSPDRLLELFNPKSIEALQALGGLRGLAVGLRTNTNDGLSLEECILEGSITRPVKFVTLRTEVKDGDVSPEPMTGSLHNSRICSNGISDRKRIFGTNQLPEKKAKNIFRIMWLTFQDKVLILLTIVAVISLALGLYQSFGQPHPNGRPRVEWMEGVAIMVAVIVIVAVSSLNDFQKERQFLKLNKKKEERVVKAIRSGKSLEISIYDVLAGDVLHLEPGDVVPADGIYISGDNLKCDESSATGEPNQVKKIPGDEVMAQLKSAAKFDRYKLDPFIISGSKVLEGIGTYLVTSVGANSSHGKLMLALKDEAPPTPLQAKMLLLAKQIAKLGGTVAVLLFAVLFVRFLVQLRENTSTSSEKAQNFLQILIISITVLVIAVPEGLPLAVTLTQAFAATKMLKDNNLVRMLRACEVMGNATVVCSDKTGTLTMNKMAVVTGIVGSGFCFGLISTTYQEPAFNEASGPLTGDIPASQFTSLSAAAKRLLSQSIAINSTAFKSSENGRHSFIGSTTESALLSFAEQYLGMGPLAEERSNADVIQFTPFDSGRKCTGCVVKLHERLYRLYVKGASEIVLSKCSHIAADVTQNIDITELTAPTQHTLGKIIDDYASNSLRTISIAYRDFHSSSWPPMGVEAEDDNRGKASFANIFSQMTFLSLVGIRDPLRSGVPEAVAQCQKAGVKVKMITGDNINTARAIATECGIYTQSSGGIVMEGPEFRRLAPLEQQEILPQLQVLARSSPEDKRIVVERLKEMGETVAVTGDGTNNGPALKMADVGFSMVTGTEIAKEASAIILMDDNFASIVKAIGWGRVVTDAVKKFLQFQITVNITAVGLTFVAAIASNDGDSVLTPVQLLWVNLIQDTFAALALATDPPAASIFNRVPERKSAQLITTNMWKMIVSQAIYQLAVTLTLNFAGYAVFSYDHEQLVALIFNVYVWMQIFNQYNNRRLDNGLNIFENIHRNWYFMAISLLQIGGQLVIISFGGRAFSAVHLSGVQWAISIALGMMSLIIGVLVRLIPDEYLERCIPGSLKRRLEAYFWKSEHFC